jgi:serine-type D-Ala-D-Ala carboxypeptidase (penicillin-binding protein 5/6)
MKWFWLSVLFGFSLYSRPLEVEVSARSAILMNAETGAVLYEKHAHIPMPPASITKIATAAYVLDQKSVPLDQSLTVSQEALKIKPQNGSGDFPSYWGEIDGTKMGLVRGETVPLDALLFGLMRKSGNDAANVIAENLSSSIPEFTSELNQYVRYLGCDNTNFCNPHGLHHEDHFTTAYDMALITKRALEIPKFRELVSNTYYKKPQTNKQAAEELVSANKLIRPGKYFYSKAIGVKTGFHSKAKYTLVGAAENKGRTLIAVLLGCENKEARYADAIRLFDLAFTEKLETRVFFNREHLFSHGIEDAKSPLKAALQEDLAISYFPSEEPMCRAFVHWDPLDLPIKQGQKVGQVQICDGNGTILEVGELVAKEAVKPTVLYSLKALFK